MPLLTKLCTVVSFVVFLYSIFKSADCFINQKYISQFLFLLSGIISYMSFKSFINSSNEKEYDDYY